MSSKFQLCKKSDGLAAIKPLDEILLSTGADPFPATYLPYSEISAQDNLGHNIKSGDPTAHWHWDWLAQPDIDALLDLEGEVYVRTEKRDGIIRNFQVFDGYMQEPQIGDPILSEHGPPTFPQPRGPIDVDFLLVSEV